MKFLALILSISGAIVMATYAREPEWTRPVGQEREAPSKIDELQRERCATLQSLLELNTRLFEKGSVAYDAVVDARVKVFETEFDAAESDAARIAIVKNLIDALRSDEEVAAARKQAAEGTEATVLAIRAKRLQAQIRLEQAESKLQTAEQAGRSAAIVTATARDVDTAQQYVCQIRAWRHINVGSLQRGYLDEVPVREGQAVKQGDLLFKLRPALYQEKLEADLGEVKIAELEFKNAEKLLHSNVISDTELQRFQARLDVARARAKQAQTELNFTMVTAPFDGLIDRVHAQAGSLITEGEVLTTLSDNQQVWVYFNMPEAAYLEYMANHKESDPKEKVELFLANGKKFPHEGVISTIEAEFNAQTGTIAFRADFPNPDGLLRHGQTGRLVRHQVIKHATVVPKRAIFEQQGKPYVRVVGKDGLAHPREVVLQAELDDVFVVEHGLTVGEPVVLDGPHQSLAGETLVSERR